MIMANSDATEALSSLVKQAKSTTVKLLQPLPVSVSLVIGELDEDTVLSGLQSSQKLTKFHPFADTSLPIPVPPTAVSPVEKQVTPNVKKETLSTVNKVTNIHHREESSTFHEHWALNQSFSSLVEQVSSSLKSCKGQAKALLSAQNISAKKKDVNTVATGAVEKTASSYGSRQEKKFDVDESLSSNKNSNVTTPVFQQLETLVAHWHFSSDDAQQNQERNNTAGNSPATKTHLMNTMQQLASLTGSLKTGIPRGERAAMLPSSKQTVKGFSGIGAGRESDTSVKKNSSETPSGATQTGSERQAMSDLLNSNHNSDSSEATPRNKALKLQDLAAIGLRVQSIKDTKASLMTVSALDELTPLMTQKVADALNDYLQEQADLHGVDL